jgi:hypothetical protein
MRRAPSGVPVMRIVADTNTVLSGLLCSGPPRRLLDMARERVISLYTSPTLLAELAEVIVRNKFAHRVLDSGAQVYPIRKMPRSGPRRDCPLVQRGYERFLGVKWLARME